MKKIIMNKTVMKKQLAGITLLGVTLFAYADDARYIKLKSYEPNIIAYRHDSNDVNYMDIKASLMYPLWLGDHVLDPYLALTGEFAQYIGTRDSSPVIGKRFNPKVFLRYEIKGEGEKGREWEYFDVGYAHESNGQSINNATDYFAKRVDLSAHGENPDFARDYLSRGWDYIDVMWKRNFNNENYSTYLNVKYYLSHGILQKTPEEYQSWEGGGGKKRSEVDGVSLLAKHVFSDRPYGLSKIALTATTGYNDFLKYNTSKLELTFGVKDIPPVILWVSEGYNSDLADYYKRVTSFGIGVELTTN